MRERARVRMQEQPMSEWVTVIENGSLVERAGGEKYIESERSTGARILTHLAGLLPVEAREGRVGLFEIRVTFTPAKP
jgi:hypothetical protein